MEDKELKCDFVPIRGDALGRIFTAWQNAKSGTVEELDLMGAMADAMTRAAATLSRYEQVLGELPRPPLENAWVFEGLQHREQCCLCGGFVQSGDRFRTREATDDQGEKFEAVEHAECAVEADRMGLEGCLDGEELWGCLKDIDQLEADWDDVVSTEYKVFRMRVDVRADLRRPSEGQFRLSRKARGPQCQMTNPDPTDTDRK
jgi:hypothetical protein